MRLTKRHGDTTTLRKVRDFENETLGILGSVEDLKAAKILKTVGENVQDGKWAIVYMNDTVDFKDTKAELIEMLSEREKLEIRNNTIFKDLNGYKYTLGVMRRLHGHFKYDGNEYICIQDAYRDYNSYTDTTVFVSYAICLADEWDFTDDTIQCYKVEWEVTGDDEDDGFNADWDNPIDVMWYGLYFAKEGRLV